MNISKNSWHYRMWMFCLTKSPIIRFFRDHDTFRTWDKGIWVKTDDGTDDYIKGHYEYHPPQNLCEYINRLPLMLLITLITAVLVAMLISAAFVLPFMDLALDLWFGQLFFGDLTILAFAWLFTGAVFGVLYLYHKYKNSVHMPKVVKRAVEKVVTPSFDVITTYIKDRHDKICRKLDFKDSE